MFKKSLMLVALISGGSILGVGCAVDAQGGDEEVGEAKAKIQTTCGGITGRPCEGDAVCVDDPNDDCNPKKGGSDCGGVCIGAPCGGFAGFPCERGYVCVDDPRDSCDPQNGGADCPGTCLYAGDEM